MQQGPITITDLLVVADATARHFMPWLKEPVPIRALTVREILRLIAVHPTVAEVMDPVTPRETVEDLIAIVGIPAIAALAAVGTDLPEKQLLRLPHDASVHAFLSVLQLTLPTRPAEDFFPKPKAAPAPKKKRGRPSKITEPQAVEEVKPDSMLVRIVKDATEYTVRTGRDGLDLSPVALQFALRVLADVDRSNRISMVYAVAAAMGDKAAHEAVGEV